MQQRPFSSFAYVLRFFWDGVPLVLWLGLGFWMYRKIQGLLGTPVELTAPFAIFGLWVVMYAGRPVRKFVMLRCYDLMLRVPVKAVCELALWKLILVHDRYWPSDLPTYLGMAIFASVYRGSSHARVMRINKILWHVEYVGRPHLAKPARTLLREVKAPLREEWRPDYN